MWLTVITGILAIADIVLEKYPLGDADDKNNLALVRKLLAEFGENLPIYVEYMNAYKEKTLTLADLNAISLADLQASIDAKYAVDHPVVEGITLADLHAVDPDIELDDSENEQVS